MTAQSPAPLPRATPVVGPTEARESQWPNTAVTRTRMSPGVGCVEPGPATASASRATGEPTSVDDVVISTRAPDSAEESAPSSLQVGMLLDGKYQLLGLLSEGGMGALYVAHNVTLDVRVAVKLLRASPDERAEGQLADRLLQEARAAAKLGHPAIVRVFDFGRTPEGDPYIVMELLEGEDLRSALERHTKIPPEKAVRTILPIVHALATAHDHGVVHRDVKPGNIFLARSELGAVQPKLIDFGVAKVVRRKGNRLTWAGAALGTPDYMAPEQALGEDVDAAADVWATCVVLYELVTGALPFWGSNHIALLHAITEAPAEPLATHGVYERELWEILRLGLEKDPHERWGTMRSLGCALAHWLSDRGVTEDICGASLVAVWHQKASAPRDVFVTLPPESGPSSERATAVVESPLERLAGLDSASVAAALAARKVVVTPRVGPVPAAVRPFREAPTQPEVQPSVEPAGAVSSATASASAESQQRPASQQLPAATDREIRTAGGRTVAHRPSPSVISRAAPWAVAALGLVVLGGAVAWGLRATPSAPVPSDSPAVASTAAPAGPRVEPLGDPSAIAKEAATASSGDEPRAGTDRAAPTARGSATAVAAPAPTAPSTQGSARRPPPAVRPTQSPPAPSRPADYLPPEL